MLFWKICALLNTYILAQLHFQKNFILLKCLFRPLTPQIVQDFSLFCKSIFYFFLFCINVNKTAHNYNSSLFTSCYNVSFVVLTVLCGVYFVVMCIKIRSDSHIDGFADAFVFLALNSAFNVRCRLNTFPLV